MYLNYVETLVRLQEIFYLYKNEVQDNLTDDELLHLMKEQFEFLCFGDLDYLEGTCHFSASCPSMGNNSSIVYSIALTSRKALLMFPDTVRNPTAGLRQSGNILFFLSS